ncbi:GNAT family N-acetyltransferase [Pelagicoccus sp. SDUM812005]|uniref:lipid II:glycine glycyltransferase FemX n=1 Tax=Pelagicoccus sp. SDUM812005 TaxID=3041257 RepID=UPI0028106442|nr:GNAT family N-acetyltransferase [Pelagicoccus sp. SDUM812005]MDQ8183743.1 GNAT family N-acetyltransferase [Pelagicoccus sp. SDUM812005]
MSTDASSSQASPPRYDCRIVSPADEALWNEAIAAVDDATRFLCVEWTDLLKKTYGYESRLIVIRSSQGVQAVLPYVIVRSPFTGTRAISLPFFDICRAYATDDSLIPQLYEAFKAEGRKAGWDYIELRGDIRKLHNSEPSLSFYNHIVDLSGGSDAVFERLASSTRRAIRKSEKSGVDIQHSDTLQALKGFYRLQCITRKRHGLPPQPFKFFKNLLEQLIQKGKGTIISAYVDGQLAASGIYLEQGSTIHYKYGASDPTFQASRCNNSVMWAAMKHYSNKGFSAMDLGRNSLENQGLRKYKNTWGPTERITYYQRYDLKNDSIQKMSDDVYGWHNQIFANLPIALTRLAGKLLYKHIA